MPFKPLFLERYSNVGQGWRDLMSDGRSSLLLEDPSHLYEKAVCKEREHI